MSVKAGSDKGLASVVVVCVLFSAQCCVKFTGEFAMLRTQIESDAGNTSSKSRDVSEKRLWQIQ
ncbi:hypothetical protein BDW22DRAFT_1356594 [Trametopsis cervina]|nr:hypothetical protein BDW22DRAFT_1356594 [Trametopsis cervina]